MPFSACEVDELRAAMAEFCAARDWQPFHKPRNLLLALVGEVGELSEIFQWRGDAGADPALWSDADRLHLGQELSDVLLYLVRLSDVCGVDLTAAARAKMAANAVKYPADRARGRSLKYTQLADEAAAEGPGASAGAPARAAAAGPQPGTIFGAVVLGFTVMAAAAAWRAVR